MTAATSLLLTQLKALKLPAPDLEYRFHPVRRWRFDVAWPTHKVALEIDGGTWSAGRHTRGGGFAADCEKLNEAILLGWRVMRVTPAQVTSGAAVRWIEQIVRDA